MSAGIKFLRQKALFGGLSDEQLKEVSSLLEPEHFAGGTAVIKEGEPGSKMYLITRGQVEVLKYSKARNENEFITTLGEGDSFGEMELIDIQPRTATVRARTDIDTLSFSNHSLLSLSTHNLQVFSIIMVNIARIISRRLRKTDEILVSIHGS